METWLFVLSGLLLIVVILQLITYRRLSRKEQILSYQSQRIEEQDYELEQKKKMLEDANQEKSQMVALLSHDLKGPFNRTFALVQLMTMDSDNLTEEQKDFLGKIHQISLDGLNMIRNLLDNKKLEEHGFDLRLAELDLSATLLSIARTYVSLAEKKKIKVHLDVAEGILFQTDKLYFTRILDNLLSNAIKFSPEGKNIFVKLQQQGEEVELVIEDEGLGISSDDQSRMFQKYQLLSARPTAGESSTGLGLYIVKALVDRLNGTIQCKSEVDRGTKFQVLLRQ